MAFGLGVLRLSPAEFWSMGLPELAAAMRGAGGYGHDHAPIEREALAHLMRLSPD